MANTFYRVTSVPSEFQNCDFLIKIWIFFCYLVVSLKVFKNIQVHDYICAFSLSLVAVFSLKYCCDTIILYLYDCGVWNVKTF